jgi:hypothetical protein
MISSVTYELHNISNVTAADKLNWQSVNNFCSSVGYYSLLLHCNICCWLKSYMMRMSAVIFLVLKSALLIRMISSF